jgi:DNA adenine methylase
MMTTKREYRSPLRYPGGKTRAAKEILNHIPSHVTHLVSPFLGGGSVELKAAERGMKVYGYDSFKPLVAFWQELIRDPLRLARAVESHLGLTKEGFYDLQKEHRDELSFEEAVRFFVLNRSSFSGLTLSGGCSNPGGRFTKSSVDRLLTCNTDGLLVTCADFNDTLDLHPDEFLYLDPPYLISDFIYGNKGNTHKGFDHAGLCQRLKARKGWVLSYNNHPEILHAYRHFTILEPKWTYGMSKDKSSKEVLILNL